MKILVIHNYHRTGSASGDDQVFKKETELLQKHGNQVYRYTVSNDDFDQQSIFGKVKMTFGMFWSVKNYKKVKKIIKDRKPDIVHIHTFFPLLSPSILYAAKKSGVKVVATLHDTRFICPCATSLRNGRICNECGDGHYFRMAKYKCFKNSRLQSLIVAVIFKIHRILKSFYKKIDGYICLNDNQIELLKNIGFNEQKIFKKYNFVPDINFIENDNKLPVLPERFVVYYGRIGEEKGIHTLMKIWERLKDIPLIVMGGGPLEEEFERWADKQEQVYFLGYTSHKKCLSIVKKAEFVLFPSIWYEGCSMVQIEAESNGKALIATDLGFSTESIRDGYNGYKVKLGDINGFVQTIKMMWENPDKCKELGENARQDYLDKYLPEDNYVQLMEIYEKILQV